MRARSLVRASHLGPLRRKFTVTEGIERSRGALSIKGDCPKAVAVPLAEANARPGVECAETPKETRTHETQGGDPCSVHKIMDESAITSWVERYQRPLFGFVLSLSSSGRERAFDVTIASFVGAFRALGAVPDEGVFLRTLYRHAVEGCRRLPLASRADLSDIAALPALQKEKTRLLKQSLFLLSFEEKCLLFLRDGRHLSQEDVAAVLQMPLKDVKLKMLAARDSLREKMKKLLGDPEAN